MTCADARDLFSALLDDALTSEERVAVAGHLDGCADCQRELGRLERTVALLRGVLPARAPVGFVDRVLEVARPIPWHARLRRHLRLPLRVRLPLGAMALLLVAGVAVYVFQRTPELQQAARQEAPVAPPPSEGRRSEGPAPAAPVPPVETKPAPAPAPPAPARAGLPARAKQEVAAKDRRGAEPAAPAGEKSAASGAVTERESAMRDRADAPGPQVASPPAAEKAEALRPRQNLATRAPAATQAAPDVTGRLVVADRAEAAGALADLAARLGASEVSRRAETAEIVVELTLPREAYPALIEGLGRIGWWTAENEPAELPARLRISIRLTG